MTAIYQPSWQKFIIMFFGLRILIAVGDTVNWVNVLNYIKQGTEIEKRRVIKLCIADANRDKNTNQPNYYWQLFYLSTGHNSSIGGTFFPFFGFEHSILQEQNGKYEELKKKTDLNQQLGDKVLLSERLIKPYEHTRTTLDEIYKKGFHSTIITVFYYDDLLKQFDPQGSDAIVDFDTKLNAWAQQKFYQNFLTAIKVDADIQSFILRMGSLRLLQYSYRLKGPDNVGLWHKNPADLSQKIIDLINILESTKVFKEKIAQAPSYQFTPQPAEPIWLDKTFTTYDNAVKLSKDDTLNLNRALQQLQGYDPEHKCQAKAPFAKEIPSNG